MPGSGDAEEMIRRLKERLRALKEGSLPGGSESHAGGRPAAPGRRLEAQSRPAGSSHAKSPARPRRVSLFDFLGPGGAPSLSAPAGA